MWIRLRVKDDVREQEMNIDEDVCVGSFMCTVNMKKNYPWDNFP